MTVKLSQSTSSSGADVARVVDLDISAAGRTDAWYVLHTRPRQEKALARLLDGRDIETFLPLTRIVRFYGHRKRVVEQPLFPSYLFLCGSRDASYDALATGRVVQLIHCIDQQALGHEIQHIRAALECGAMLAPHAQLRRGCRVRVTAGPFAGLEGLVEQRVRPERLILQVQTLGRAASLEIDADLLEPVD
jgi:transcriptional antiterminator RfaH